MGVLIIDDRPEVHGIPEQIASMSEIVLTVQVRVVVLPQPCHHFCPRVIRTSIGDNAIPMIAAVCKESTAEPRRMTEKTVTAIM